MDFIKETQTNIDSLVKMATDKTSWKNRLKAVNQMKQYDCHQVREVITGLALHNRVFKVKEEAFRVA